MNANQKFLSFLHALKKEGNEILIENITHGFQACFETQEKFMEDMYRRHFGELIQKAKSPISEQEKESIAGQIKETAKRMELNPEPILKMAGLYEESPERPVF